MKNLTESGRRRNVADAAASRNAVREEVVARVSHQIRSGAYDPPLDALVDHLVVVLAPFVRSGR